MDENRATNNRERGGEGANIVLHHITKMLPQVVPGPSNVSSVAETCSSCFNYYILLPLHNSLFLGALCRGGIRFCLAVTYQEDARMDDEIQESPKIGAFLLSLC